LSGWKIRQDFLLILSGSYHNLGGIIVSVYRTDLQEYTVCTSSSGNNRETTIVFHVGGVFKIQKQLLSSTGYHMCKSCPLEHYTQRPKSATRKAV